MLLELKVLEDSTFDELVEITNTFKDWEMKSITTEEALMKVVELAARHSKFIEKEMEILENAAYASTAYDDGWSAGYDKGHKEGKEYMRGKILAETDED